ncbi:MAG: CocE/NonD family hydrolase [Halofilum sp. (in: g-proteobacteria)]
MNIVEDFPFSVHEESNVWIPMADGIHLAARIWRPVCDEPVPVILEYIPYRKRFGTVERDEGMHGYLAGHGYACARVDLRGSGESGGVLTDEYLPTELEDGRAVISWLAQQSWSSGDVGMIGISWGGFNGLQIAAMQPPELKAVITCCSTDDRFGDDVHHMGGCLLGDNISWASVMFGYNSLPPDPDLVGEQWRDMWLERLHESGLWLETWLRHQRRDEYWRHGSVCEDYGAIQCPVMAVSGWADGYSNAVFRLLAGLQVPRKGLIGPWSHKYPHLGVPGPAIGFLQEQVRWWDHWLKGIDHGLMDEPMLRVWMQESVPPTTRYARRPGRWVAEMAWPSPDIKECVYGLARGELTAPGAEPPADAVRTEQSPLTTGLFAGKWCSYAAGPDLAHDQRQEDGGAEVFDSDVLDTPLEVLGSPVADLEVSADRPVAMIAARLSDVAPDDKATRVTYGLLNLTHRDSSGNPEPLEPGRRYRVRVMLNGIAQNFPAGHRLRLSLSTSYWPLAWAPPEPVRLTVYMRGSRLRLPLRKPRPEDESLRPFGEPEAAATNPIRQIEPSHHNWVVHRDLERDASTLEVISDQGVRHHEAIDLVVQAYARERYSSVGDDFESLKAEVERYRSLRRGSWGIRTVTRTELTCTREAFLLRADLDAYEQTADGEKRIFCRSWDKRIPRDLV